jgi:hypothetical protein
LVPIMTQSDLQISFIPDTVILSDIPLSLASIASSETSNDVLADSDTSASEEASQSQEIKLEVLQSAVNIQCSGLEELFEENIAAKLWRVAVRDLENNVS